MHINCIKRGKASAKPCYINPSKNLTLRELELRDSVYNEDDVVCGDDDDDGLPAYSHHDKIPPWWEMSVMIKVGMCQCQIPTIHDKLQQLALVSYSTPPLC